MVLASRCRGPVTPPAKTHSERIEFPPLDLERPAETPPTAGRKPKPSECRSLHLFPRGGGFASYDVGARRSRLARGHHLADLAGQFRVLHLQHAELRSEQGQELDGGRGDVARKLGALVSGERCEQRERLDPGGVDGVHDDERRNDLATPT